VVKSQEWDFEEEKLKDRTGKADRDEAAIYTSDHRIPCHL
jgi:hypothetical protein